MSENTYIKILAMLIGGALMFVFLNAITPHPAPPYAEAIIWTRPTPGPFPNPGVLYTVRRLTTEQTGTGEIHEKIRSLAQCDHIRDYSPADWRAIHYTMTDLAQFGWVREDAEISQLIDVLQDPQHTGCLPPTYTIPGFDAP
jgi:hypothetical protein